MRKLITKFIVFSVIVEWLARVDIGVLAAGMATLIAVIVCADLLRRSSA